MSQVGPKYRLVSQDLLRTLMKRTGDGAPISGRQLAQVAGIAHGTIGMLLVGRQETISAPAAQTIASRLGVDLLVLWVPVERAATTRPSPSASA
ncbi:hypothetical protein GCM10010387_22650 [Streptomyces inusitatus]|uniref:HTH cro/C1-type domain-containing protein n=1 Tax=Streptomyces inusitatus TaxID=68221 RepID=A0A918URM9_9ACTN|nr:helix-turn-helix transcriptional regulator [Streptomyces inusitatus]GGZ28650.1 hypothetical protein GCM10010387_22650 [Streptomyces inusitatus]